MQSSITFACPGLRRNGPQQHLSQRLKVKVEFQGNHFKPHFIIISHIFFLCLFFNEPQCLTDVGSSDRESSLELIKLDISRTFPQLCIFQKVSERVMQIMCQQREKVPKLTNTWKWHDFPKHFSLMEAGLEDLGSQKFKTQERVCVCVHCVSFSCFFVHHQGGPYHDVLHSILGAYTCYRPDVGYVSHTCWTDITSCYAFTSVMVTDVPSSCLRLKNRVMNLLNRKCFVVEFLYLNAAYSHRSDCKHLIIHTCQVTYILWFSFHSSSDSRLDRSFIMTPISLLPLFSLRYFVSSWILRHY